MTAQGHKKSNIIVAGGGTGGHALAGVAIGEAWLSQSSEGSQAIFVGARGRIEEKILPKTSLKLHLLSIGSLNRVGVARRLKTLFQLPFAILKSMYLILTYRPKAVVGVGGFSSGPLVLAAWLIGWLWGTKIAVLEQNSVPGFTNKILSKMAGIVFVCFEYSKKYFKQTVICTGNPIRSQFTPLDPASRAPFEVFVFGGSQGALGVNSLVLDALPHLVNADVKITHQTGPRDLDRVKKGYEDQGVSAEVSPFIDDMKSKYEKASLVICRAGASTLSELAAVKRAAILIPLPTAADNHQEINARVYSDAGAALLVDQNKTSGKELADLIIQLAQNPSQLSQMEEKVLEFYRPNAAGDIVKSMLQAET